MTKPIILVKMCYIILCVIKGVTRITSWPQLISNLLVALPVCNVVSDWPCMFLHPRCFCLAYHYFLYKQISLLYRSIYADGTLKLSFEKLKPVISF